MPWIPYSIFNFHNEFLKYHFAIRFQAPVIWNNLPLSFRKSLTVYNFRKKLKYLFFHEWKYITYEANDFDVRRLISSHSLRQVVKQPTRGSAVLDLIVTNLHNLYSSPSVLAPLGSGDHSIVQWLPTSGNRHRVHAKPVKRLVRRYPRSGIDTFGRWITSHGWFSELGPNPTADELAVSFTTQLTEAIDRIFPLKTLRCHQSDKPWITPAIKLLIQDRQKAFHSRNTSLWRSLKYKVHQEITARKKSYYKNKIQHLRKNDCRKWWNMVNRMSGRSEKTPHFSLERNGRALSQQELVTTLNEFYCSVNADIPPLEVTTLPAFLPAADSAPTVQAYEVCKKLLATKPSKAHGPDNVPCRIVKEFAYELAEPVTAIFNASLTSGTVPEMWKNSNITPILKTQPPTSEGDTRPFSLTPCLSKTLEDFVVQWLIADIRDKIDPDQFGCLKGTSTTYCLLDMIHTWLLHLESPGKHLRLIFLDFSKAFDRIGHNILIGKLIDLGVRRSLIPWIVSFLSNRRQRVKLGEAISAWLPVNAGVPQGTKLGPILFLVMVNNLSISSTVTSMWKYVDDISLSEVLTRNSDSTTQTSLDTISAWASLNRMNLNAKKCKELRVCYLRETPRLAPLQIDDQALELVSSHKVLGLVIQSNLKWNDHITAVVSKASKRLHILRVLRRGGVPAEDLLAIYCALIRSVLEYCCVVWHHALPSYLSEDVERVQMRALRVILPGQSYKEALKYLGCPRLDQRRNDLCMNTIKISGGGPLSKYLPQTRACAHDYPTRNRNNYSTFRCRTERFQRSFFPSSITKLNE